MAFISLPSPAQVAALWAVTLYLGYRLLQLRPEKPRLKLTFHFPVPSRANLSVTFDGKRDAGPFSTHAALIRGGGLALTRDAVDGLPDGENRFELFAPMEPLPIGGENMHRTVGMIGIEGHRGAVAGRIKIQIFNGQGRPIAAQTCDF